MMSFFYKTNLRPVRLMWVAAAVLCSFPSPSQAEKTTDPASDKITTDPALLTPNTNQHMKLEDPGEQITAVEEKLLKLSPVISQLSKDLTEKQFDGPLEWLTPQSIVVEPKALAAKLTTEKDLKNFGVMVKEWETKDTATEQPFEREKARPLAWLPPILPNIAKAEIKTYDGEFLTTDAEAGQFRTKHKITFRPNRTIHASYVAAELYLTWDKDDTAPKITRWELTKVKLVQSTRSQPLIGDDGLDAAIPDKEVLADLRKDRHETFLRAMFANAGDLRTIVLPGFPLQYIDHITIEAGEQHPAVSVADINNDGWDDIYVMRRWGENRLLINQKNGTFTDEAEKYGLNIDGHCSVAVFADYDNDGDQDVFIGRTLERSLMLENIGERFINISEKVKGARLPYLVATAAAADYDGDGVLDLYIGTYFGHTQARGQGWQQIYIEREDRAEFKKRTAENKDYFYDFVAPPNLMLHGTGGCGFERAVENDEVKLWRATLQVTWVDWDFDGDQDLLVTNDFGPDIMLRNDPGQTGETRRHFTSIAPQAAPYVNTNYFGMGACWGDYDEDGHLDLYLSAMFSKAGTRITGRLSGYEVRARQSALGNLLMRGTGGGQMEKASGQGPGEEKVDQVGWAWGGQFFDPNNDGWLDLYAPTGYFTPPKEYSSEVDY